MSDAIKRALYEQGRYQFPVPPVCHDRWTEQDWFNYVDGCRGWRPQMP